MLQIIPNWHPVFVHFTMALLPLASVLFVVSYASNSLFKCEALAANTQLVARWMLYMGVLMTLVTLVTGGMAYNSVAHDALGHAAMTLHKQWALPAAGLFFLAAIWCWFIRCKRLPVLFVLFIALSALPLLYTGYLGAENVYRHGLGVMRVVDVTEVVPDASAAGVSKADVNETVVDKIKTPADGHHNHSH